jgi:hypothetical protein
MHCLHDFSTDAEPTRFIRETPHDVLAGTPFAFVFSLNAERRTLIAVT